MEETNVLTPETPEEKKRPGGGKRALQICLAVLLLAAAVCFAVLGIGELTESQETGEEPAFFDATVFSPDRQYLEFNMLTDSVATFTLGENHGIYLAFYADDTGIYPYLICLSQQNFERYQDIYEFTFDDRDIGDGPGFATVYGYSQEISDELKDYAIEYFNYFTDTDLLNDGNFEEYLGSYYLDTTAAPAKDTGDAFGMLAAAAAFLIVAVILLLPKRQRKSAQPAPVQAEAPAGEEAAAPAWEIQPSANPVLGILGAVLGSLAGAAVWIVLYRLGYIAGIAGYLAAFCAIWGYQKLGRGRAGRLAVVLCVLIAMLMLALSNGVAYAWVVADTINETNPGRASIAYILSNFSSIMESLDLWRSFWGDLVIGLILALVAGISPLAAAFKANKKQSETV